LEKIIIKKVKNQIFNQIFWFKSDFFDFFLNWYFRGKVLPNF